jgi:hypothetical protein
MFICVRTEYKAVYGFEELFGALFRNPFFVDVSRTVEPRDTVVILGDEAIKT